MLTGHRAALVMCIYYILKNKSERSKRKYLYKKYLHYKSLCGVTQPSSDSDSLSEDSSSEDEDSSSDDDAPLQNSTRKRVLNTQNRGQPAKRGRYENGPSNAPKLDDMDRFGQLVVSALRRMPQQKSKKLRDNILKMIKNVEQGSDENGACSSTTKAITKFESEVDSDDEFLLYEEPVSPTSSVSIDIKPEPDDSEEEVRVEASPDESSDPLQPVVKEEADEALETNPDELSVEDTLKKVNQLT